MRLAGFSALCVVLAMGCGDRTEAIIVGTAHIEGITRALTDDTIPVQCLVPPATCPGHSDLRPSDLVAAAQGGLIILHAWQQDMPNVNDILEAAAVPASQIEAIGMKGSWMSPPQQVKGIHHVAKILMEKYPDQADSIEARANRLADNAQRLGNTLFQRLEEANVNKVNVLCAAMQEDFVSWAGFNVIGVYHRPEEMSVSDFERLVATAKESDAALVIDNLQSGETKTSETLARDAGCAQVVLSNFPGGFEGTESWDTAVKRNVELLLATLDKWRQHYE